MLRDERASGNAAAPARVEIAYCTAHGLHGARERCYVCSEPVEHIPMMLVSEHQALREAAQELVDVAAIFPQLQRYAGLAGSLDALREVLDA